MRGTRLRAPAVGLGLAIFLASCQPAPTGNLPSSSPRASGVASPTVRLQSPAPTTSPRATLPPVQSSGALIVNIWNSGEPTEVSLWSADSLIADVKPTGPNPPSSLVANFNATDRNTSVPSCHPYRVTYLPCVSTSNSRAYFLDGDTNVRYLTTGPRLPPCDAIGCPLGQSGGVTHVPGGAGVASAFAVSPDDKRIAVSAFTFRSSSSGPAPVSVRLYVEDLVGNGNHIELFTSTSSWVWPVGWHDGKLVVAAGSPVKPVEGPYGGVTEFHLVDPVTGDRLQALGSATCPVVPALLSPAGTVCLASDGSLRSQYWSGQNVTFVSTYAALKGGAMLSPDGSKVAVCCANMAGFGVIEVVDSPAMGGAVKLVAGAQGYFGGGGWIDATHLIYHPSGTDPQFLVDTTSHVGPITLPLFGEFSGRVPGGL